MAGKWQENGGGTTKPPEATRSNTGGSECLCVSSNMVHRYHHLDHYSGRPSISPWNWPSCLLGGPQCPAWAQMRARWLHNPVLLGSPNCPARKRNTEEAEICARWLHNPCLRGGPQCPTSGKKLEGATPPLPSRGPKSGQNGCITPFHSRGSQCPPRGNNHCITASSKTCFKCLL